MYSNACYTSAGLLCGRKRVLRCKWQFVTVLSELSVSLNPLYTSPRAQHRPPACLLLSPRFAQPPPSTASSSFHFHPHQPPARGREFNQHHLVLEIFQLSVLGTVRFAKQLPPVGGVKREREREGKRRGSLLGIPRRNAPRLQRHPRSSLSVHMGELRETEWSAGREIAEPRVERHREFLYIAEAWGKRKYERG